MAKRKLTSAEISDIISFLAPLKGIPSEVADAVVDSHKIKYTKQLSSIELYPDKIPAMKSILEKQFHKAQIEAGKCAGALSSSSIGEKNTQNSLSSFHSAGQTKVQLVTGVPRLEEFLNATRHIKTPCMDVYFNLPESDLKDLAKVKQVAQNVLEYKEMIDFVDDYTFTQNRELTESEQRWYSFHETFYSSEYDECEWSVRLKLDTYKLYSYKKSVSDLAQKIHSIYADAHCVCSPDNVGILDIYIQTDSIGDVDSVVRSLKSSRKKKRDDDEDTQDGAELSMLINDDNKEFYFIRDLVIPSILYMQVSGIEGISQCYYEETPGGKWMIKTKGSNLRAVICNPLIVATSGHPVWGKLCTTSNHMWDVFEVYGIEATKTFLKTELSKLANVSSRHLDTLINCMTHTGRPVAVSRYGIDKKQVGTLAKVAFEQPFDNFFNSAMTSEKEDVSGISAAITVGIAPPIGSGMVTVLDRGTMDPISVDKMMHDFDHQIELAMPKRKNPMDRMNIPRVQLTTQEEKMKDSSSQRRVVRKSGLNTRLRPSIYRPDIESISENESSAPPVTRMKIKGDVYETKEMERLAPINENVFRSSHVHETSDEFDAEY